MGCWLHCCAGFTAVLASLLGQAPVRRGSRLAAEAERDVTAAARVQRDDTVGAGGLAGDDSLVQRERVSSRGDQAELPGTREGCASVGNPAEAGAACQADLDTEDVGRIVLADLASPYSRQCCRDRRPGRQGLLVVGRGGRRTGVPGRGWRGVAGGGRVWRPAGWPRSARCGSPPRR